MSKNISDQQKRYLSQAIRLEEVANPAIIRITMATISLTILVFIVWAYFTNINEVAHTPGEVTPLGHQQAVQHLEGGIVKKIHVQEGGSVQQGDVLLTLDGGGSEDDLNRAVTKKVLLSLQEERLRAFSEGRPINFSAFLQAYPEQVRDQTAFFNGMIKARGEEKKIIHEQITQKRRSIATLQADLKTAQDNLDITQDLYNRRASLNKKGYVSDVQYLETKQKLNEITGHIAQITNRISVTNAEIAEFQNRLNSLDAQQKDQTLERLDQVMAEMAQNDELIEKLKSRVARLEVKAPTAGFVKGLSLNTIGAVVQPGQVLMEIVPTDEKLVVQIKIPPQHIGHVKAGQPVQIKFSSFDFSRYGFVSGTLEQISASTFEAQNGSRYYEGRVSLEKDHIGANPNNKIMPGMTAMADIITGKKTILDYLLKPIQVAMNTSFTER